MFPVLSLRLIIEAITENYRYCTVGFPRTICFQGMGCVVRGGRHPVSASVNWIKFIGAGSQAAVSFFSSLKNQQVQTK